MARKYQARDERAEGAAAELPDHFARVRAGVRAASAAPRRAPDRPDALLCVAAAEAMAEGAWPRELSALLGVPRGRWGAWLRAGAADREAGADTPEAALSGAVERATVRLEQGYRQAVEGLASGRAGWQAACWLLTRLAPASYCERVEAHVLAEVDRLLAVAAEALPPAAFAALVTALESARDGAGGPPPAAPTPGG